LRTLGLSSADLSFPRLGVDALEYLTVPAFWDTQNPPDIGGCQVGLG
jgi:hypothetical protein